MTRLHFTLALCLASLLAACGSSSTSNQNGATCTGANALSCGAHGTCDESSGAASCVCATGYAGTTCDTCASGYQDKDGNGTCQVACSASTCSGNGTCDDSSGTATCTCNTGFTGADCSTCGAGLQDKNHDGTCEPACTATTCGSNGACDDSSGTATCTCSTGYTGAACDTCASGYQDNDANGTCAPACTASTCGANGTCDDSSGAAVCTCSAGYAGATCGSCDTGYQDNDGNGTCTPACTASTCNAASHFACDDSSGTATCACAHGYVDDGSGTGTCVWSGILQDPGFDNTPAGAWSVSNGVIFSSAAQFDDTGACTAGSQGVVSQAFTLPDPSASDPLAVSFDASASCSGANCGNVFPARLALSVAGKRIYTANLSKTSTSYAMCVGEAAYQPNATLSFLPADRDACQYPPVTYSIADADFSPDSACPPLGSLKDGDFSKGGAGWSLSATEISDSAAYGTVEASGVIDGSPDGHVHVERNCSVLTASVPVSVPFTAGTAIHFDTQLTAGEQVNVQLDGTNVGTVRGTGGPQFASMCIPQGLSGWVHTLSLSQNYSGTCSDSHVVDLYVDNVSLVSDASCAVDLQDPSAEADPAGIFVPWTFNTAFGGSAGFTQVADDVHAGSQGILLENTQQCGFASATVGLTLGALDQNGGPALTFWYKNTTDGTTTSALVTNPSGSVSVTLPQTTTWQKAVVCTPPERAGDLDTVEFENTSSGSCGSPLGSTQDLVIDDLQVTTEATCPAG